MKRFYLIICAALLVASGISFAEPTDSVPQNPVSSETHGTILLWCHNGVCMDGSSMKTETVGEKNDKGVSPSENLSEQKPKTTPVSPDSDKNIEDLKKKIQK